MRCLAQSSITLGGGNVVVLKDVVPDVVAITARVAERNEQRADTAPCKAIEVVLCERMATAAIENQFAALFGLQINVEIQTLVTLRVPIPIGIKAERSGSLAVTVLTAATSLEKLGGLNEVCTGWQ